LHFNHGLRGRAAAGDEEFCARVCRSLRVGFRAGRWKRPHGAARPSEAEARAARHGFFAAELQRRKARTLWLGHQQDDVAETLFMRLARGSGAGGLAAPRPVQRMPGGRLHVRPLLALKKSEIAAALTEAGATWREDATNARPDFLRNRVRGAVLPAWRRACGERDALAGAALSRELLEEDDTALEHWLMELGPVGKDGSLSLRRLAGKPRGLVRRAVHAWLARNRVGAGLSRQAFNALLEDVMRGRVTRHSVGAGVLAEIGRTRARIARSGGKNRHGFHRRLN
ncbi:MAG TPA: tRNA lysidine(34) synthetase TilS, partial [Opitutus sp.]|nr:tRNA lysidine(34) synthetase TilS [Opitutus sp.]